MQNMKLGAPMTADGGSSPMVKAKGDKQVEYLDLDLDSGKSTPPRKVRINQPPHSRPCVRMSSEKNFKTALCFFLFSLRRLKATELE